MKIAEIFLNQKNKKIDRVYDYLIPKVLENQIKPGLRVTIPFGRGNRVIEGFVIKIKDESSYKKNIKEILEMIDDDPILIKEQIELCLWMKFYYCSLFYEALSYFVASIKIKKEITYCICSDYEPKGLKQEKFIRYYFNDSKIIALNEKKIDKDDSKILKELVVSGLLIQKKTFKIPKTKLESNYAITMIGQEALKDDKRLGINQQWILKLLNKKNMTDTELKVFPMKYRASLNRLIEKEYICKNEKKEILNIQPERITNHQVVLTHEEEESYKELNASIQRKQKILLHVFNSTSKYRLFFKSIQDQLNNHKGVILLFPEINITYQRMEVFYKYFGDQVAAFHGKLTAKEQQSVFKKVQFGDVRIVIGVRSALFLPMKNLGLVIIDDEHDLSYFSISAPRFHVTDVAKKYCELVGAALVLADDIPRITTWHDIMNKKMQYITIGKLHKIENEIQVVDMQNEIHNGNMGLLSRILIDQIKSGMKKKRLSVLLINKKGYASCVFCRNCGHVEKCPQCGVALKYFDNGHVLQCHYCGYEKKVPINCSECGSNRIRHMGFGIDQVEKVLNKGFPIAKIVVVQGRLKPKEIKEINDDIKNGRIDILIGTQVLIKYFDLSQTGLAGAILIDGDLNQGNYKASENVYQMYRRFFKKTMTHDAVGIIQTNEPENETIYSIVNEDDQEFYNGEIHYRKLMKYPPIMDMIIYGVFNSDYSVAENDSYTLYFDLKNALEKSINPENYRLFKPISIGVMSGGKWRFQIIFKIKNIAIFQKIMPCIIKAGYIEKIKSKVSIEINS